MMLIADSPIQFPFVSIFSYLHTNCNLSDNSVKKKKKKVSTSCYSNGHCSKLFRVVSSSFINLPLIMQIKKYTAGQ